MSELYFRKKEQLSNAVVKIPVLDASSDMERKRSLSPAPRVSKNTGECKKVAYSKDVEDLKTALAVNAEETLAKVNEFKKSIDLSLSEQKSIFENTVKNLESNKNETLKTILNDTIKATNVNISNISNELIALLTKLNEIDSRLTSVEDVL